MLSFCCKSCKEHVSTTSTIAYFWTCSCCGAMFDYINVEDGPEKDLIGLGILLF